MFVFFFLHLTAQLKEWRRQILMKTNGMAIGYGTLNFWECCWKIVNLGKLLRRRQGNLIFFVIFYKFSSFLKFSCEFSCHRLELGFWDNYLIVEVGFKLKSNRYKVADKNFKYLISIIRHISTILKFHNFNNHNCIFCNKLSTKFQSQVHKQNSL